MAAPIRSTPTRRRRIMRRIMRLLGGGLALLILGVAALWLTTPLPTLDQLRNRAAPGNTRILDRRGALLYAIPDPLAGHQRPIGLDEIPPALRQATIAVEDRSFYANRGVDLRGIARAAWYNLRSGAIVGGGSTITQQLARNFMFDPATAQAPSLLRKLREATLAVKLTSAYSKDDILALYLNQTFYGGTAYGVEAAAQYFFGKPARDLDLAECALIAGLPQAPSRYNPFADRAAALARQGAVLDAMVEVGVITPDQAAAARAEPLQFAGQAAPMGAPHFVNYVIDRLLPALGPETLLRGGLTITTTLDADLQAAAEQILRDQLAALTEARAGGPDHRAGNGAVVVLDPQSGAILAMVGSPDFADAAIQGQVNAAVALRQPGSAIKPLTYAAAMERGWTPASTILDIPTTFSPPGKPSYSPENYDHAFHGPLPLRQALATSSNVAAVRTLDAIGVPALLEIAGRFGITSLDDDPGRYGLSLTLGGGEVSLLELTDAYATFASGGDYRPAASILAISDARGAPLDDTLMRAPGAFDPAAPRRAIDPAIAYLISDILSDPYARSRAYGTNSALDVDRPAAVKTGTTSDWRDNWTVGYTPDRAVGVWVGNADGRPMEAISGVSGAGPIWHAVMLAAHRGLPSRPFVRPAGVVEVEICAEGGLLPSAACPSTRLERFAAGNAPTRPDDTHALVRVDPLRGCRLAPASGDSPVTVRMFRILPAEAAAWAEAAGVPRPPARCPDAAVEGESETAAATSAGVGGTPLLLAPNDGDVFAISGDVPRDRQQIAIRALPGGSIDGGRLTLLLDGAPLAEFAAPPYQIFWPLAPGAHRVQVVATDAQGRETKSAETHFVVTGK